MRIFPTLMSMALLVLVLSCKTGGSGELKDETNPQTPSGSGTPQNSLIRTVCEEATKEFMANPQNANTKLACTDIAGEKRYVLDNLSALGDTSPDVKTVSDIINGLSLEAISTPERRKEVIEVLKGDVKARIDALGRVFRTPSGAFEAYEVQAAQGGVNRMVALFDSEDGFFLSGAIKGQPKEYLMGNMVRAGDDICKRYGTQTNQRMRFTVAALVRPGCQAAKPGEGASWTCRGVYHCVPIF